MTALVSESLSRIETGRKILFLTFNRAQTWFPNVRQLRTHRRTNRSITGRGHSCWPGRYPAATSGVRSPEKTVVKLCRPSTTIYLKRFCTFSLFASTMIYNFQVDPDSSWVLRRQPLRVWQTTNWNSSTENFSRCNLKLQFLLKCSLTESLSSSESVAGVSDLSSWSFFRK